MYDNNPSAFSGGMYDRLVSMGYTGPERGTDAFAALRQQGQHPYRDFRQQWRADHPNQHMWQNWQPQLSQMPGLGGLAGMFNGATPGLFGPRPPSDGPRIGPMQGEPMGGLMALRKPMVIAR